MNVSDIAISSIKGADYDCVISRISKNKAINLMQKADLTKQNGTIMFCDIEIEKNKFCHHKSLTLLKRRKY